MATIITYDLHSKHTEVKKAMYALGYAITFRDQHGKVVNLPNTTLYHTTKTPATAVAELRNVCTQLAVHLERCIATSMADWSAIYGDPL